MAERWELGYTDSGLSVGKRVVPANTPVAFIDRGHRYEVRVVLGELCGLTFYVSPETADSVLVVVDNWKGV